MNLRRLKKAIFVQRTKKILYVNYLISDKTIAQRVSNLRNERNVVEKLFFSYFTSCKNSDRDEVTTQIYPLKLESRQLSSFASQLLSLYKGSFTNYLD